MNIIVAILFDNYADDDDEDMLEEYKILEEKAEELGIPDVISDIIIHKDLVLGMTHSLTYIDAKSKTPVSKSLKKY